MDWEELEALYWRFDAMHKGYGEWSGRPTSERDAFKRTVRQALVEKDKEIAALKGDLEKHVDIALDLQEYRQKYQQLMEKAVWFARQLGVERVSGGLSYIEYPERAQDFLASPEVQAWKEQQG